MECGKCKKQTKCLFPWRKATCTELARSAEDGALTNRNVRAPLRCIACSQKRHDRNIFLLDRLVLQRTFGAYTVISLLARPHHAPLGQRGADHVKGLRCTVQ